jgi:hypothetical protein
VAYTEHMPFGEAARRAYEGKKALNRGDVASATENFLLSAHSYAGDVASTAMALEGATSSAPKGPASPSSSQMASKAALRTETAVILEARDAAVPTAEKIVAQELAEGWINTKQKDARVGTWVDALAKAHVRQAITEGQLSSAIRMTKTIVINTVRSVKNPLGAPKAMFKGTDIWNAATGVGWDLHPANSDQVIQHMKHLGQAQYEGTVIRQLHPVVY